MATQSSPQNLWDLLRRVERRLHALEAGSGMDWASPTLLNSWVLFDPTYVPPRYRRMSNGQVEIQGVVKSGTVSTTTTGNVFVLPVGYRPSHRIDFPVMSNGLLGRLDIFADGSVRAVAGSNVDFGLNCTFTPTAT